MDSPNAEAIIEANERASADRRKLWQFRANFLYDVDLEDACDYPSGDGAWAVDGELQAEPLTEESLFEAVNSRAPAKPTVTVCAPNQLVLARIIGFQPPYRHAVEALA